MPGDGTISVEMTMWCSTCETWEQEGSPTKRFLVECLRRRGWTKRRGLWVCPGCIRESKSKGAANAD